MKANKKLETYLKKQKLWSTVTFGRGMRTIGIIKHIKSELKEIQKSPSDLTEWIDIIILGLDGYWRAGGNTNDIMKELTNKQNINFKREYKKVADDKPSYHIKERSKK